MDAGEVLRAGRGWWRLADHAERERYVLLVGGGSVRVAAEALHWHTAPDGCRRRRTGL
ncbi:hypothetical protein [Yinghuangia soli]|uniref:Uncharacterized protein n=1 Tax=Yinghuangia soli TaxID=2908204 RepID=A0AA41Q929_9ACTN|nr:hypothetical protein [Yinghuangia soli]MCF2533693.1 hypothetical protein [Yinghuangia soli]